MHISELAKQKEKDKNISRLEDILEVGKEYQFEITDIDSEGHKINLSLIKEEPIKKNSQGKK